jgi:hypothetical protein
MSTRSRATKRLDETDFFLAAVASARLAGLRSFSTDQWAFQMGCKAAWRHMRRAGIRLDIPRPQGWTCRQGLHKCSAYGLVRLWTDFSSSHYAIGLSPEGAADYLRDIIPSVAPEAWARIGSRFVRAFELHHPRL